MGTGGKPIPLIMDNLGHRSFFIANLHVLHNHCFESADTYPCEHSRYVFFSNCDLNVNWQHLEQMFETMSVDIQYKHKQDQWKFFD